MGSTRAQIAFLRKFAHFYDSGVALTEALGLAKGEVGGDFAEAIDAVIDDIYRGNGLADSLQARPQLFSPDIIALIRVGELRGDLSGAARSAADGLGGGVLDAGGDHDAEVEALLITAGDAHLLHVSPEGELRVRGAAGLEVLDERARPGAIDGLLQRAGLKSGVAGTGAFLWQDRLIRVAAAPTGDFVSLVLRISGQPASEPEVIARWRAGPPRLLLVHGERHADFDGVMRALAASFEGDGVVRVAVDLPVPELLAARDVESALQFDPDLLLVCRMAPGDLSRIADAVESGVRVAVAARSQRPFAALDPLVCEI